MAALILAWARGVPSRWASDRFDVVWRLASSQARQDRDVRPGLSKLLAGDSAKPII
jgi:hypothetical protein